jgi:cytochrome c oxidase subunit 1/cytochrome c oxidase subunit I+III
MYAVAFIVEFVLGGVTGVMFAVVPFDQQVTDTYFVVAHFHYVLFGGAVLPMLAGLYYWWPKISGYELSERAGKWTFWVVILGMNLTFFPMHISGLLGMPRRIYTYGPDLGWTPYNQASTIGAFVLGTGLLLTAGVFVRSLLQRRPAVDDPWGANTLEWATASPPEDYNFPVIPTVHSLNPLWDDATLPSMAEHRHDERRTMTEEEQTLRTSELDARIERVMPMPSETPVPLFVATALGAVVVCLLCHWYVAALAPTVVLAGVVTYWLWNRPAVTE